MLRISHWNHRWKVRMPMIVEEIVRWSPDVICLQEVDLLASIGLHSKEYF